MAVVLSVSRCVLVVVFLRAGLAKVVDIAGFRSALREYRLLPSALIPAVALSLPFAEIVAAILLAAGIFPGPVAAVLASLLVAFAAAIAINLARGRVFDCGCSGTAKRTINWKHVASNIMLAGAAFAIALAPPRTLVIWLGIAGPFFVATPRADVLPAVLATVLGLTIVAVLSRAATVSSLSRMSGPQEIAVPALADARR